jgi:hypothetical protein
MMECLNYFCIKYKPQILGLCKKQLELGSACTHEMEIYCKQCYGRKYGPRGVGFGLGGGCLTADSGEKFGNKRSEYQSFFPLSELLKFQNSTFF